MATGAGNATPLKYPAVLGSRPGYGESGMFRHSRILKSRCVSFYQIVCHALSVSLRRLDQCEARLTRVSIALSVMDTERASRAGSEFGLPKNVPIKHPFKYLVSFLYSLNVGKP